MLTPSETLGAITAAMLGVLLIGQFSLSWYDIQTAKEPTVPDTVPDAVKQSESELDALYQDALAKAQSAGQDEAAAVAARGKAEDSKTTARTANAALLAKLKAHQDMLANYYQAPQIPPSVN